MKPDRKELQNWYRDAMLRRIDELVELRPAVAAGSSSAFDALRRIGQALRGSGGTFGFPRLSAAAGLVETTSDPRASLRLEGLLVELRGFVGAKRDEAARVFEWLEICGGLGDDASVTAGCTSAADAWAAVVEAAGTTDTELAGGVADRFGLESARLSEPGRAARRLVPEAFMVSEGVVPLSEDSETITVASAVPVSLAVELELGRLTGRRPVFAVAPPRGLQVVLERLAASDAATGARVAAFAHSEVDDGEVAVDEEADAEADEDPSPKSKQSTPNTTEAHDDHEGDDDAGVVAMTDAANGPVRVLVVDDEPSARLLIRTLLEKRGFDVIEAADGLEALKVIGEHDDVRLAVVDLNMPRMDGLELIWELRDARRWADLPVIVVTGEKDEILETQIMEEGADDYIRKPVDPRLFLARVDATLRRVRHASMT